MFLSLEQKVGYPATVKIVEENSSLIVQICLRATWGTFASPDFCNFYNEFGRIMKQASVKVQTRQPILSSQKLPERANESSPPSPTPLIPSSSPPPSQPLSPSSPPAPETPSLSPAMAQKSNQQPLTQARIIWAYVNLREGPGIQYKMIGKAYMDNTLEILDENPGWLRVRLENRTEGWMSKRAASESSKTPSSQSTPASSHDSSKPKFLSKPHGPM